MSLLAEIWISANRAGITLHTISPQCPHKSHSTIWNIAKHCCRGEKQHITNRGGLHQQNTYNARQTEHIYIKYGSVHPQGRISLEIHVMGN